ncbi:type II secretion system F family protein [Sulfurimonas autotrophica]|uniref:Type II secretion system F domain protein n=1 Tax=Sulfurimonas autotrophica (strain ATCC BAA-671 / DSM 16294 / JCM 11897 / OK10) TaxID=563040 RepID=E0UU08_SULAO|nr:type II secretion system F family protein [Sulfurimonas autotrophica]ADN08317.1 Type II secretion system F domain protein [Sulfurimonas autotrophica DSM 16294]
MKSIFEYEAVIGSGEVIQGSFAGTKEDFELMLQKKKLLLTSVKETKEKVDNSKFTQDDFLAFIEELYYLTKSGMPIDKAVKVLSQTTKKAAYKRILKTILEELKAGEQLSTALKKALKNENITIDSLAISFISTAEEVGSVTTGLYQLFEYLTFQKKIRSDVKQALAYPFFLIGMSIVVSFLIFFLIIPRFSTIFSADEFAQLPGISYAVLSTGKFLNAHMGEAFAVIGIVIAGLIVFFKKVTISWMSFFYKVPKLSSIIIDLQLTIVYSALSTMLVGGLEIDKALKQLQSVSLLPELKNLLKTALFEIKRGQKLSDVFAMSSIIPTSDIALLYVGESSASLAEVFKSLSIRHSDAFSANVKKILSILEPAVIVGLGVFIAIIVVAIMMAVMSMTDMVG